MTNQIGKNRMQRIDDLEHVVSLVQRVFYRPYETIAACGRVGRDWRSTRRLRPSRVDCMSCIAKGASR